MGRRFDRCVQSGTASRCSGSGSPGPWGHPCIAWLTFLGRLPPSSTRVRPASPLRRGSWSSPGVGINAWTAAEGSLKIRETSYVASEGLACEAVLHGPAVALGSADALVCLDGGSGTERLDELAKVVAVQGARVHRFSRPALGEALSIFALTVVVQKIAVEAAEARGTNPDSFGRDLPGRTAAWASIRL
jgi:hypothetical protein